MANTYMVGVGHNLGLGSMTILNPRPRCEGLQFTRETPLSDGSMHLEGMYLILQWSVAEDIAQYVSILSQCGLNGVESTRQVTLYAPDEFYDDQRYNATAVRPFAGAGVSRNNFMIRDVSVIFRDLVKI